MAVNTLICYIEDGVQKWNMANSKNRDDILLQLLTNKNIDNSTIFAIPTSSIMGGIWIDKSLHKSQRVDFHNFFEDLGYEENIGPLNEAQKEILSEHEDKFGDDTKYGWISPEGKYFHCNYQGHSSLADKICFGMVETSNPERYLEEHGWCKIYKNILKNKYSVYIGGTYCLSDEQMETLKKLGLEDADGISAALLGTQK